jgi:hypothetical protein
MASSGAEACARNSNTARPQRVSVDEAAETLGSVLRAHLRSHPTDDVRLDGDLRRAIHLLCLAAHQEALHAEQLLISVKKALNSLPEVAALPQGSRRAVMLSRVISLCIEEFYAEQA